MGCALSNPKDDPNDLPWLIKGAFAIGVLVLLGFCALCVFRVTCVTYVDNYELGYKFDSRTGEITILPRPGYWIVPPFLVSVHTIDLRPMQVCINANSRVLNCKLVKFNPEGVELFLSWHGRGDYGAMTLNPILMSYAYDGSNETYPFLSVIRELKGENAALAVPVVETSEPAAPEPMTPELATPAPEPLTLEQVAPAPSDEGQP